MVDLDSGGDGVGVAVLRRAPSAFGDGAGTAEGSEGFAGKNLGASVSTIAIRVYPRAEQVALVSGPTGGWQRHGEGIEQCQRFGFRDCR